MHTERAACDFHFPDGRQLDEFTVRQIRDLGQLLFDS